MFSTEKELKLGKMVQNMKENGEMEWPKDEAHFIMPTVTYTPENLEMTELTDMVLMFMKMGRGMKETGKMIFSTATELKSSMTAQLIMGNTRTGKNADMVFFPGLMEQYTEVTG
mgnify:FL=1